MSRLGAALDAAMSRVDVPVEHDMVLGGDRARPKLDVFGEHTPEPTRLPPSLGHLSINPAKIELDEKPIPLAVSPRVVEKDKGIGGAWLVLVLATIVAGGAAYYFLGL